MDRKRRSEGRPKGCRRMEFEVEKGLKGAARFIQRGLQPAGVNWGKERGGQPDKQNPCCFISARLARHRPFIRARFRPALGSFIPFLLDRLRLHLPLPPESLLNASSSSVLSVRYFSSSLINGTVASLAGSRVVQSKDTSEWVSTSQATPKATLSLADGIQVSMTGDDRWWLADGL